MESKHESNKSYEYYILEQVEMMNQKELEAVLIFIRGMESMQWLQSHPAEVES